MTDQNIIMQLAKKVVHYPQPDPHQYAVTRDIPYRNDRALDLYLPVGTGPFPVVVHANGYPFPAALRPAWLPVISWARLLAAAGTASVIYDTVVPETDGLAVIDFLRREAGYLGLDLTRACLMASSGHGPLALGLLMDSPHLFARAVFNYPFLMDLAGCEDVANAAVQYGFANPVAGRRLAELPRQTRLLVTRAGCDTFPGLLDGLDRFVAAATGHGLSIDVLRHDTGEHGFDLEEDSSACRECIHRILAFMTDWR